MKEYEGGPRKVRSGRLVDYCSGAGMRRLPKEPGIEKSRVRVQALIFNRLVK